MCVRMRLELFREKKKSHIHVFLQASVEILFVAYNPQVGLLGKVRMVCAQHIVSNTVMFT